MHHILYIFTAFILLSPHCKGQHADVHHSLRDIREVGMMVLPQGHISIRVNTNVNHFFCSLEGQEFQNNLPVKIREKGDSLLFEDFHLPLKVIAFDCGPRLRTKEFRTLLEHEKHPWIKLSILELHIDSQHQRKQALISIGIHGKKITRRVHLDWTGDHHLDNIKGECDLLLSDFDIAPPVKAMGLIKVRNEIRISFDLQLRTAPSAYTVE